MLLTIDPKDKSRPLAKGKMISQQDPSTAGNLKL